jgi:sortase A
VRRKIQVFGWTLIWSGVFIFGYLGWQLFGTDLVNAGVQAEAQDLLADRLLVSQQELPDPEVVDPDEYLDGGAGVPSETPELVEFHPETAPEVGEEMAFLRIPKIGVDQVLFEGVDPTTLKSGPGHMEGTPVPGQPGNSVISGHRTTYGRPFFDFDLLVIGDTIEIETAVGVHTYEVREIQVVQPTDVWVTKDRPGGWVTFTTCEPKFSARQRLVVWAEMVDGPNIEFVKLHKKRFG